MYLFNVKNKLALTQPAGNAGNRIAFGVMKSKQPISVQAPQ